MVIVNAVLLQPVVQADLLGCCAALIKNRMRHHGCCVIVTAPETLALLLPSADVCVGQVIMSRLINHHGLPALCCQSCVSPVLCI